MSSEDILKIKDPGLLFPQNLGEARIKYAQLIKDWHPDVNQSPKANEVFIHIKGLYDQAIQMIKNGSWIAPGEIQFKDKHSITTYRMKYHKHHLFELGDMYVNDTSVMYVLDEQYKLLVSYAKDTIKNFKFSSNKMRLDNEKYLPPTPKIFETKDNKIGFVVKKSEDLLFLRDVKEKLQGMENRDRHVAWILSTLYNLSCYLGYTGLCHNAISVDNYFISPQFHSGMLLGGWWYSVKNKTKMRAVPPGTYNLLPPDIKASKIADHRIDQELIKEIGRELLGDKTGVRLLSMKTAPIPMISWLRCSSNGSAVENYRIWNKVLEESFGKKKFVKMELDSKMLYGEG